MDLRKNFRIFTWNINIICQYDSIKDFIEFEKQRTEFTKDGLRDPTRLRWMHVYYQIRI